jgi:hypothetical protein
VAAGFAACVRFAQPGFKVLRRGLKKPALALFVVLHVQHIFRARLMFHALMLLRWCALRTAACAAPTLGQVQKSSWPQCPHHARIACCLGLS